MAFGITVLPGAWLGQGHVPPIPVSVLSVAWLALEGEGREGRSSSSSANPMVLSPRLTSPVRNGGLSPLSLWDNSGSRPFSCQPLSVPGPFPCQRGGINMQTSSVAPTQL